MECYGRAANLFKMAKKWSQAGQTFVTVATHHAKLGNKHDSATNYVDAANCYKKSDPKGKLVFPKTAFNRLLALATKTSRKIRFH